MASRLKSLLKNDNPWADAQAPTRPDGSDKRAARAGVAGIDRVPSPRAHGISSKGPRFDKPENSAGG